MGEWRSQAGLGHLERLCDPGQWKGRSWCSWLMVYGRTQFLPTSLQHTHAHITLLQECVHTKMPTHTLQPEVREGGIAEAC